MKKKLFFMIILFLAIVATGFSQIVDQQLASRVAAIEAEVTESPELLKVLKDDQERPELYFFRSGERVLVIAGEKSVKPYLAELDHMPDFSEMNEMPYFFQWYRDGISHFRNVLNVKSHKHWQDYELGRKPHSLKNWAYIQPLIKTVWGQRPPYNAACPGMVPVGCAAIAWAQVIYYWHTKDARIKGHGKRGDYNFGETDYLFDEMGVFISDTATANNPLAIFLRHVGESMDMNYDVYGSAPGSTYAWRGIPQYWGLSRGITAKRLYNFYGDEAWEELIYSNISKGRPVAYTGYTEEVGHEFILDGYNLDGFFHINYGWSGSSNGYYELSPFDSGFSFNQMAEIDVFPIDPEGIFDEDTIIENQTLSLDGGLSVLTGVSLSIHDSEITISGDNARINVWGNISTNNVIIKTTDTNEIIDGIYFYDDHEKFDFSFGKSSIKNTTLINLGRESIYPGEVYRNHGWTRNDEGQNIIFHCGSVFNAPVKRSLDIRNVRFENCFGKQSLPVYFHNQEFYHRNGGMISGFERLTGCEFINCKGYISNNSEMYLDKCIIRNHTGNALKMSSRIKLSECLIVDNTSDTLLAASGEFVAKGSTIANNMSDILISVDGDQSIQIENTILWDNEGNLATGPNIPNIDIAYSCWPGENILSNNSTLTTEAVISANPQFLGSGEHPYSLKESSPCIDAGSNSTRKTDMAGNPGVIYIPDIGAYEFLKPMVIASQSGDTTVCVGNRFELFVDAPGYGQKYQWMKDSSGTWTELDRAKLPKLRFNGELEESGTYTCRITNDAGETWADPMMVVVDACMGIKDVNDDNKVLVYPNPISKGAFLYIDFKERKKRHVQIYSLTGELLLEKGIEALSLKLDTKEFPQGLCIVKMISDNEIYFEKVLIK